MSQQKLSDSPDQVRETVREGYTRVVERASSCCGGAPSHADEMGLKIGYSQEDLTQLPEGANLGLGCGNPTAIAALRPGEVVLDLGSGAGIDTFLAARQVGPTGRVIGIDMTDAMLEKARENAQKVGITNVEFRKGTIEELPIEDGSIDVIISNCVINLSPEKEKVFREAYRVLRPGGLLMVSDLVLERLMPPEVTESVEAYIGCVGGARLRHEYLGMIEKAGFREVRVEGEGRFGEVVSAEDPQIQEAAERFDVTIDQVKELLGALTSLHVLAVR
jgi:SAM-dependent methyltransferase